LNPRLLHNVTRDVLKSDSVPNLSHADILRLQHLTKGCADTCMLIGLGNVMSWVKDYKREKLVAPKFEKIGDKERWVNQVKQMEGDGNCLFRSISHQIYNGDQSHYDLIR
jgi:hypothetical protein